MLVDRLKVGLV